MKLKYILMLVVVFVLASCGNSEDVMDYTEVEFSGIDTRGTADYVVDEAGLLESLYDVSETDSLTQEEYAEWEDAKSAADISLDNQSDLSNGDVVTLTVAVDEEATDILSGGSEEEIEVSDLPEGTTLTSEDLEENVSVSFEGMDGEGTVEEINQNFEPDFPELDFDVENDGELSNDETAVFTVSNSSFDRLSQTDYILDEDNRTFEVEVSGLREPEYITQEELTDNIIITFTGASGRGEVENLETTFSNDIPAIDVEVENEGELENGETAVVNVTDETLNRLNTAEYAIEEDDQQFEVEVDGLTGYAAAMSEIENLEDVKRFLQEETDNRFEDSSPDRDYGTLYEVEFHQYMYRQFEEETQNTDYSNRNLTQGNGNLFGIFTVETYSGGDNPELEGESIVAVGFNNMELDENQEVNISDLSDERVNFDDSYSLDTVTQLLEGMGYTSEDESSDTESDEDEETEE